MIRPLTIDPNDDDAARRFNRTENVEPIAPPIDFRRLFRIRNDADSINRGLDDSMYLPGPTAWDVADGW